MTVEGYGDMLWLRIYPCCIYIHNIANYII